MGVTPCQFDSDVRHHFSRHGKGLQIFRLEAFLLYATAILPTICRPKFLAVVNYGQEFYRTRKVSQDTFDAALAQFGVLGLTELTNLMGCYSMLAFNVNAFGVELPEDSPEKPLPV